MLLPHGYEGQGPEHSSARLERFLQLCAQDNLQVVNCTTPANYFHALRRQLNRDFRKPLIVMTPKSLLRHKECVSNLSEMAENTSFHRVLYENELNIDEKSIERVVICSGKVFYDLKEEKKLNKINNVKILRLEQLYPFPKKALTEILSLTPKVDLVWCQEEPKNMGSWFFVKERLEEIACDLSLPKTDILYAGRAEAASPATGSASRHKTEQKNLIERALIKDRNFVVAE